MEPLVIASKVLSQLEGLDRERKINAKVIIDLVNRVITVEGNDYTYTPTGAIISTTPFKYEVDNIPSIPKIPAIIGNEEVLDGEGNVLVPAIATIPEVPEVPANSRFDRIVISPIGQGVSAMIQGTLNLLGG